MADAALLGSIGSMLSIGLAAAHFPSQGVLSGLIYHAFECVFVFPVNSIFSLIDICLFGLGLKGMNNDFPHSLWYLPGNLISYSAGSAPILPFLTINWLYHAVMESSAKQATLGKLLLQIRVTDSNGQRISFGKATARHFSKILSTSLLFIGFMMAGWTKKKQALHDKVAGCLVVGQITAC